MLMLTIDAIKAYSMDVAPLSVSANFAIIALSIATFSSDRRICGAPFKCSELRDFETRFSAPKVENPERNAPGATSPGRNSNCPIRGRKLTGPA